MNAEQPKIGDVVRTLPANRLLASVGIGVLLDSETLFNTCEEHDAIRLIEISNELYLFSGILAAFSTQHESLLKTLEVVLPDEINAIVTANPFYEGNSAEGQAQHPPSAGKELGDHPF